MDKSHNDIHSNNSKQEINNNKEKEKIVLPKINRESKNIQNNLSDINNSCHYVKCDIPKINKNNPTFLTLKKTEADKINLYRLNNNIPTENNLIFKLLKEKIEVNNKRYKVHQTYKDLGNRLKMYIDDASLYKNSHFIHREKKNIKQVKLGKLFISSNLNKSKYNLDSDRNQDTIDLRIYKNLYEDKPIRFKSLDKRYIKNEISDYYPSNWRKNLNCGLKYKYNKNKESIDQITLKIQIIDNKVKETFDGFKNEADDIFKEIVDTQNNTRSNSINNTRYNKI
jgi:hypothetical protein